ncbi:uncharacterized protein N7459_007219 [Penicillium hispanicum]|uniref:uncharacterized protein n=1 Tax=Penicillium hispanicum TaxID=1080232 RepID=UPI0025413C18|nr:uncharacterized protein N7459_007219 [Penicillium hispanicum]KAJ5578255.1 hypothetical protein N7459_007219 [Penicillium hispanicum]
MDLDDCVPDPFSSESFWRLSRFSIEALQPLEPLPWIADLPSIPDSYLKASPEAIDQPGSIWKWNLFNNDIDPLDSPSDSVIDSVNTESRAPSPSAKDSDKDNDDSNIWALDALREEPGYVVPLRSWEKFQDRSFGEPVSAYFTESGANGFDAALAYQQNTHGRSVAGRIVRHDIFLRSLLHLGLGWSSPFFRYNPRTMTFERYVKDARVSGMSLTILEGVVADMLQCGTNMLRVRSFARTPPIKAKDLSALFTLRGTVLVIMYHLEHHILGQSSQVVSLLQATALFHRCGDLIGALADIVGAAEQASSDAQVISTAMKCAAFFAQKFGWMQNLMHEIVVRVTEPWFGFIEGWIGLRPEEAALNESLASGRNFVQLELLEATGRFRNGPPRTNFTYCRDNMPSFIPSDQAQSIFESGRSLRLLKNSHPDHPIARQDVLTRTGHLRLCYVTTWADIERIQKRADAYEAQLRAEILRYHKAGMVPPRNNPDSIPDGDTTNKIVEKTFELFDIDDQTLVTGSAMDQKALSDENINQMLQQNETSDFGFTKAGRFGPELTSSLYLSLAPVISSQAKLIDFSCLYHLFKEHNVRHHLNLQRRFQLLGDGSFTSRLSYSLFDPEMESGERKSGVMRSGVHTGLRLGSRDTWPPASSELRLVLIGLLGDCYFGDTDLETSDRAEGPRENELPGGLSFAVRELTSEEIERCKDPNAIEALDFLRLQYKPPEALEALITTRSLNKYDRLFKHLLRLLRMVSVVKGLIRDSTARGSLSGDTRNVFQRFRIDAQHFVLAISDYCFHIGIGSIWSRFQETLAKIERCLDRGDIDGTLEAAHSVPRLRDFHEDVLDQMLFAFFLSKRHTPAAKLLDTIFSIILAFSPLSKADGISGLRHENEGTVLHMYSTFKKQVHTFVGYLRGLDSGKASSKSMGKSGVQFASRTESTTVFEHLRIRLDVKDYY